MDKNQNWYGWETYILRFSLCLAALLGVIFGIVSDSVLSIVLGVLGLFFMCVWRILQDVVTYYEELHKTRQTPTQEKEVRWTDWSVLLAPIAAIILSPLSLLTGAVSLWLYLVP